MNSRLLLAFALVILVTISSQFFLKKYFPEATPAPKPAQTETQPAAATPVTPPTAQTGKGSAATSVAAKQASAEAETVIENDLYRITFTNRGALVKSWVLKKFDDEHGKQLDLVNGTAAAKYGHPLSLWLYDEGLRNLVNSALYVSSAQGNLHTPSEISFEYADQNVSVRKTFRFDSSYVIHTETAVLYKGSTISAFPMWPAGFGDPTRSASYGSSQIEYQNGSNIERLAIKKISSGNTIRGPFSWSGVTDQYFAAAFIPEDVDNAALVTLRHTIDVPKDLRNPNSKETVPVEVLGIAVGSLKGPTTVSMYVGPKSLQVLESVSVPTISGAPPDLRGLINFGFFSFIARPLFLWLKWTYAHIIGNWGWAIALQTLIINLALLPLRITQMKSALKMQKIQPQLKAIQEKYKKYGMRDPRRQEMQKEMWAVQQKEGVNMFGGCLPMIIQLPFLFAYYGMLGSALDLRHASWLWIHDLSSPDPLYLLPLGVVLTMIVNQKMTPQAGMDPTQQKMMMFMMPVMMGVISFNLAAGLCLYWFEGTLIGIVQQMIMNRTSLGQEMRELAAKRARKKDK